MVGFVPRHDVVYYKGFDERGKPVEGTARHWHARILQHETDHLDGTVYVDRMEPRTFMASEDFSRHWGGEPVEVVRAALDSMRKP